MDSFHEIVAKALEANRSPEEISLMETEEKFASLALAFRTDRHTLDKRIELHLRARDIAEKNIQKELESLKDGIKVLNQHCGQSSQQTFAKIHNHLEVLEQSITRMSSRAEDHGAVQQELRVSQVIETMVQHVENLKRVYETEHAELQEARKAMSISKSGSTDSTGSYIAADRASYGSIGTGKGSLRRISLALMAKNPRTSRKISLQSDSLIPATAPSNSASSPSFFYDNKSNIDSCSEETSTGSSEKNFLNRQNNITATTKNIRSINAIYNGRESKCDNKLTTKTRVTSGESLSSNAEGRMAKRMSNAFCQRHLVKNYLAWLTPLVHVLVERACEASEENGRLSFLLGAFSKFPLMKTYFGFFIVLMLISLGFFLIIYHCWMASNFF